MLDVSTVHAPDEASLKPEYLERWALCVAAYVEGVYLRVPYEFMSEDAEAYKKGHNGRTPIPDWLDELFQKAFTMGCEFVKLDADGEVHEDLQQYEWQ